MKNLKNTPATELFRNSLDKFLSKDMIGWSEFLADDVVADLPFAPEGTPNHFEGKEAFYDFLKDYPSFINLKSITALKIHATDDKNVAIAELSLSGEVIANGNPYEMSYVTVVTFRDGLIVNYRDYWNPQVFMKAMGGVNFASE
nr:nuclear transport factor 2 family protein [uncultured Flavobacterium sp.]